MAFCLGAAGQIHAGEYSAVVGAGIGSINCVICERGAGRASD